MTESTRHLSWENLDQMVRRGVPAIHRVIGTPVVDIFVDQNGSRLGLRTSCPGAVEVPQSSVVAISIELVWLEGSRLLEVSTRERRLYAEFYSFCVSLADRLQLRHYEVIPALLSTLANWHDLLRPVKALSIEQQIGLAGEVWLLSRLVDSTGIESVRSWTGPQGEPHDFRRQNLELEVKVTLNPTRSHVINGELQLVASPNHDLWLLSLQFEPAGTDGVSLPSLIDRLRDRVRTNAVVGVELDRLIAGLGYSDADRGLYSDRWQFRTAPRLVPVDSKCPKITRDLLTQAAPDVSPRISDVHYRVDVEGLGYADASGEYQQLLPIGQEALDVQ